MQLDCGGHTAGLFDAADLIVLSPGVPPRRSPRWPGPQRKGVPVLGEIEIARRELPQPLAAITGTNGKSTVTTVMGEIFRAWGKRTFVGGNLGTPLIEAVGGDWEWLVVELSSFQLEGIRHFRPRWAVLLNITEDHLDRYPDMAGYQAAKARMFENQTADDWAVLNADDPLVVGGGSGHPGPPRAVQWPPAAPGRGDVPCRAGTCSGAGRGVSSASRCRSCASAGSTIWRMSWPP